MIKRLLCALVAIHLIALNNFIYAKKDNDMILIDSIAVSLFGQEGTEIITKSDIERPGLNGEIRLLDDVIFELLVFLDAKKHKAVLDESAVDQYLESLQRENNLTREQLEMIFAQSGYTFEEGRQLLLQMQTISSMIDFKIRSNLIISKKDIETYYNENPVYTEPFFEFSRGLIPYKKGMDKERQKQKIGTLIEKKQFNKFKQCIWSDPFSIKESHVNKSKIPIDTLSVGDIVLIGTTDEGFELFRLNNIVPKQLVNLDERYNEIARILQKPRFEELMQQYKNKLFEETPIVHLQQ